MDDRESSLINFIHLSEGLKNELRNGCTSTEKPESVADHTWRVSFMVLLFAQFLDQKISLEKALKMAIVHDLAELITGDKPCFFYERQQEKQDKFDQELKAMKHIESLLPEKVGNVLFELWHEYEAGTSYEARFVKAVDKIEAQIQHNEMSYGRWNDYDRKYAATRLDSFCEFDSFLTKIKTLVQEESLRKIADNKIM
ncbi:MAG: HD domain-containing protein [Chlamydiota bacterium]